VIESQDGHLPGVPAISAGLGGRARRCGAAHGQPGVVGEVHPGDHVGGLFRADHNQRCLPNMPLYTARAWS
jgi:hypothetical protein